MWPRESNPRRPCLQSTARLTELVRPSRPGLVQHRGNRQLASNLKLRDVAAVHQSVLAKGQAVKLETFKFDGIIWKYYIAQNVRPVTLENEIIAFLLFFGSYFVRASVRSFCK